MVKKVLTFFIIAMVALAVWRGTGGNINGIVDGAWGIIETGAGIVQRIWEAVVPVANDAVNNNGS